VISIIPVLDFPLVQSEDEFWASLISSLRDEIQDGDILVLAHTPYSRVAGPIYKIEDIVPSAQALEIASQIHKDPRKVEIVLKNSTEVVKVGNGVIITKSKAGIICANAGVDESNTGIGYALGIPEDPDVLAQKVRSYIFSKLGVHPAVIISDTVGRALRIGAVNIAIGVAGIDPLLSKIGSHDLFGYELKVTRTAIADELASAAELLQGQSDEGIPLVIIRGYKYVRKEDSTARLLNRPDDKRLFR